jgi:pimeloyl-ACP methyl ester carboxylesterase
MPFSEVNGVRLFYTDEGIGQPVLLVHGTGCDSYDWNYQLPALLPGYRVIAADRRGHGHSSAPESGYSARQEANDLAQLLENVGAERTVAIGHSTGGGVVAALAAEFPDKVRALVAVDPSYGIPPAARVAFEGICAGLAGPDGHEVYRSLFDGFYTPSSPPHLRPWHTRRIYSVPKHALAAAVRETALAEDQFFFSPQTEQLLGRVSCPVLTIRRVGEGLPTPAWDLAQFQHPYSKSLAWSDCGHWPHQERPDDFNDILVEWLQGLS